MKKNILIVFSLFLSLSAMQGQLLWKVSGKGLKHPSYLFGTYQLIPIQYLDSIPGLFKAFNECDMVVGEMAINNLDTSGKIRQAAIMPDNTRLNDLLNDEQALIVDNGLKSVLKLGLKDVSIMNPSLILSMYETEIYKKLTGISDDSQSESYFQLVAAEKNKRVAGLETVDQQIAILYGNGTLEHQADMLVDAIQQKDKVINKMIQLHKLYKEGNMDQLVELSKDNHIISDMTDEDFEKLVDNRTIDWVTKLPAFFSQSSCFVAVGAIHLGGKNGLVKQLQKAGYKVKAVE